MSRATAISSSKEAKSFRIDTESDRTQPSAPVKPLDAIVDGRRVVLHAADEILLECGASSILLRKDGKIVLKGTQIVSRASGRHKIRGSSVQIN
jgi:hypothetical protein